MKWLIFGIFLLISVLAGVQFDKIVSDIDDLSGENEHNLNSERRTIQIVSLALNVRSFINIVNGLEQRNFTMKALDKVLNRDEYLERIIHEERDQL